MVLNFWGSYGFPGLGSGISWSSVNSVSAILFRVLAILSGTMPGLCGTNSAGKSSHPVQMFSK